MMTKNNYGFSQTFGLWLLSFNHVSPPFIFPYSKSTSLEPVVCNKHHCSGSTHLDPRGTLGLESVKNTADDNVTKAVGWSSISLLSCFSETSLYHVHVVFLMSEPWFHSLHNVFQLSES